MRPVATVFLLFVVLGANTARAVDLSGTVTAPGGAPVCALVLASGVSTFSCSPVGQYSLRNLSLEPDGSIKLAVYADGFRPYAQRLTTFGQANVEMLRQYDNGLSDRSSLDGDYRLIRASVQSNDGSVIDAVQPNVSFTGSMTISGSTLTQTITATVDGVPGTATGGGSFLDGIYGWTVFEPGGTSQLVIVERGRRIVTMSNSNYLGSPSAEVVYWFRLPPAAASALSASGADSGVVLGHQSQVGSILRRAADTSK